MKLDQVVQNEAAIPSEWGFGVSKLKGTGFFWMKFILPELVASNGDKEVTVTKEWYLTDNTIDYVLRDLSVLGWYGKDMAELDPKEANAHDFLKAKVLVTTKMEEFITDKGDKITTAKVAFINDPNYTPIKPMDKAGFSTLNAKLKGKIAAYRAKVKTKDDIPF